MSDWAWIGADEPAIAVAGHSHRNAYRKAILQGLVTDVASLEMAPGSDRRAPDGRYWKQAADTVAPILLLVWTGNQHNHAFLFEPDPPIRLHDVDAPGMVIPEAMVAKLWQPTFDGLPKVIEQRAHGRVLVLGTPPPKDEPTIRAGLAAEPQFVRKIEEAGHTVDTVPLTDGPVRVALWRLLQRLLFESATAAGADFIPIPSDAVTDQGYLRPELCETDASHANARFGRLMLDQVATVVG